MLKVFCIISLLFFAGRIDAQHTISLDLAAIRNMRHDLNGVNFSSFYHFNEHFIGGIEINRFFAVKRIEKGENIHLSAWDLDLNFHYLLPVCKNFKLYPLTGISHTSEKESLSVSGENHLERFWSYNTGAGILWEHGKWAPHVEYMFTWGKMNQQFLLAGLSYELEGKKHGHEVKETPHP